MIKKLNELSVKEKIGNKAKNLQILSTNNFNVPSGIVITNDILENVDKHIEEITANIEENKLYAVRSSGLKEDTDNLSFAGLYNTYLNVKGKENIIDSIKKCYESRLNQENIEYCQNNNIDINDFKMAVIVQEMVLADFSGIGFTINPVTGADKEIITEIVKGLGDKNVSGKAKPEKNIYNWYEEVFVENNNTVLSEELLKQLNEQLLNIQILFGYPVDVEFAIKDNTIYFLQVRPITKIMFSEMDKQWTTANFRDGGVSSRVCLPLMASMYTYALDKSERYAMTKAKFFKPEDMAEDIVKYFYGKLYWNVTLNKAVLAQAPGYVEREYDSNMGIPITYEGNGETTQVNWKFLKKLPAIIIGVKKTIDEQMNKIEQFKEVQLKKYYVLDKVKLKNKTLKEMEKVWKNYIENDFFINEITYLMQAHINSIKENTVKPEICKYVDYKEYLNIVSGIKDLSHTRPLKKEKEIVNKITKNSKSLQYWKKTSEEQIIKDYEKNKNQVYFEGINEYIKEYGYHSNSDLDLTVDPYYDDVSSIIVRFKNNLVSNNLDALLQSDVDKNNLYTNAMNSLREKVPSKKLKKLEKQIEELRNYMWWREELKDLSNRYYALVKKYTKALAQKYYNEGILNDVLDIHYLKYNEIIDFIDKKITKEDIYKMINKNKKYCNSFINFKNPNDIDKRYKGTETTRKAAGLQGVGCSAGIRTGKVRIVKSLDDINKIQKGEILVTKFIDTGWISRFGILNGVVSEYGGMLCHSSIVAREYEIPAIIGIQDVEKLFKDGEIIEINGYTGEIKKV